MLNQEGFMVPGLMLAADEGRAPCGWEYRLQWDWAAVAAAIGGTQNRSFLSRNSS